MKDYSLRNEKSRLIQASATSLHEHITELFENGYDQGYADAKFELGQNAIDLAHEESDRAYQQGLEDAWEAAKKIHDGQIPYEVFGLDKTGNGFTYASPLNWGENMSSSEAIAKIKEYEEKQKQDSIQVGDEVCYLDGNYPRVVVGIFNDGNEVTAVQIAGQGVIANSSVKELRKTGRHFPQIAEVLAEMRGDKE